MQGLGLGSMVQDFGYRVWVFAASRTCTPEGGCTRALDPPLSSSSELWGVVYQGRPAVVSANGSPTLSCHALFCAWPHLVLCSSTVDEMDVNFLNMILVLPSCYSTVAPMLQYCCPDATVLLPRCYSIVAPMLQYCYSDVCLVSSGVVVQHGG